MRENLLPTSLVVGPYTFRVKRPKKLYSDDGSQKLWGHIRYEPDATIDIWRSCPDDRAWVTLLHEVLHAIDECVATDLTEEQVTRLAPALFAFLADNGWLSFVQDDSTPE